MPPRRRNIKVLRPTILIVGEGYAEVALLQRIKGLYTSGREGCSITIKNAHGYGALNVIRYAASQRDRDRFDSTSALFDTDTDWDDRAKALARKNSIAVLPCDPCVERVLLDIKGLPAHGDTAALKTRFRANFGGDAHEPRRIEQHFDRATFDGARTRVEVLNNLLEMIRV